MVAFLAQGRESRHSSMGWLGHRCEQSAARPLVLPTQPLYWGKRVAVHRTAL